MDKLPKSLINKFEMCHKYQSKSDNLYWEIREWFEKNEPHVLEHTDFTEALNEIQCNGLYENILKEVLEYINEK